MFGYEFTQNLIMLSPWVIFITAYLLLLRGDKPLKWYRRAPIMILFGWFVTLCYVIIFHGYSIHYAPTEEIKLALSRQDRGAAGFAALFGWAISLILLIIMEIARFIIMAIFKKLGLSIKENSFEE